MSEKQAEIKKCKHEYLFLGKEDRSEYIPGGFRDCSVVYIMGCKNCGNIVEEEIETENLVG